MGDIERLCAGFWTASELAVGQAAPEHLFCHRCMSEDWSKLSPLQSELDEERTLLLVAEEAEPAGSIVGLVLLWLIADEAQIIEMAVHPAVQRRGIGSQLLTEALRISTL